MSYDCAECVATCCAIYRVRVTVADVRRLADGAGVLLRHPGPAGDECVLLDPTTRRCTVYDARPDACRGYPPDERCVYFDVHAFERRYQGADIVPVVRLARRSPPVG